MKVDLEKYQEELKICSKENSERNKHESELELLNHEKRILKDQYLAEDTKKRLKREISELTDTRAICEAKIDNLKKFKTWRLCYFSSKSLEIQVKTVSWVLINFSPKTREY